jgi:glutaredoxin
MDNHYYLWIKSECPFCLDAVGEMVKQKKMFSVFTMDDSLEELSALKKARNWETVPLIVEKKPTGEEFVIGGFTDLQKYFSKDK